jgi:FAD/FMN-containing dehydrogenase
VDLAAQYDVGALQRQMQGIVAVAGDEVYANARAIWNGAIDRYPAVVASCTSGTDVAAALAFAQEHRLEVSVRGGGHNYAGHAVCEGGLMIDLTPMKAVTVDLAARRASCGGGTTWAELDAATQEHGLALPGGFVSHTGVAGLTLGGGFGWLSRMAGLSCDNLVGAEVVLTDGTIVTLPSAEHDDLLWALRGGGGNFGVVTRFEFSLVPVGPLVHLALFFVAPEDGGALLRFTRDYVEDLPDDCGVFLVGLSAPPEPFVPEAHHLAPKYALAVVGFGTAEEHARLAAPAREALPVEFELVTPLPYTALQQMFDAVVPWGSLAYEKAVYLDELTDGAIEVVLEHQPKKTHVLSLLPIFVLGGAFERVADDATAFGGRRSARYMINIAACCDTQASYEADRAWVRAFWADLVQHAPDQATYVNYISEPDEERVRASYGTKYDRLTRIKARYDPGNVLHLNANIRPAGP